LDVLVLVLVLVITSRVVSNNVLSNSDRSHNHSS